LSKSWQHCNSKTASESTNLNFSHHIAGTYNRQVLEVDCIMCTVPFKMGFSPSEHDIMEDFELFKRMGVTNVEEMRTIRLMVAAYNMNNKQLGHLTMQQAEKYNLIPKEQCGSRKRHKAINCLLNKVLIWDISRQLCLAMALMSMQQRGKMLRLCDPQRHKSGYAMHRNAKSTHHSNANLSPRIIHSYPNGVWHLKRVVRRKKAAT